MRPLPTRYIRLHLQQPCTATQPKRCLEEEGHPAPSSALEGFTPDVSVGLAVFRSESAFSVVSVVPAPLHLRPSTPPHLFATGPLIFAAKRHTKPLRGENFRYIHTLPWSVLFATISSLG